jgi:hypothetical protein
MRRWFFRAKAAKGALARNEEKRAKGRRARTDPARTKIRKRRSEPQGPLSWNDPDQDFITRYGDPYDG